MRWIDGVSSALACVACVSVAGLVLILIGLCVAIPLAVIISIVKAVL